MDICSYPQLIAACHVLQRLLMPSHSPYALISLTLLFFRFSNYLRIRDLVINLTLFFEIEVTLSFQLFHAAICHFFKLIYTEYYSLSKCHLSAQTNWKYHSEKPFLISLVFCFPLGFDLYLSVLLASSLYHRLHCSVFKVQLKGFFVGFPYCNLSSLSCISWFLRGRRVCVYTRPRKISFGAIKWSNWWRWGGSNSWPPACKAGALPAELHPHFL